jgi:ketosteroid isomerase-like protein
MPNDVRAFFESYRDAFNRLDGRGVSAHYQVPSMISSRAGEGLFATREALEANNLALCAHYAQSKFLRADFRVNHFVAQGDDFCFADLAWTIEKQSSPPDQFNTSYQLVKRADHRWRIEHVTAYSEQAPKREPS